MQSLHALGLKYGTDKAANENYSHRFCDFYEFHLSAWRNRPIRLLEIGICKGASLRMWEEFFPNGEIVGIDSLAEPGSMLVNEGRIKSFQVDQGDALALTHLRNFGGPFDIVIDDGSHFTHHQDTSYAIFSGAPIFIWEDLHTSRMPGYVTTKRVLPLDRARQLAQDFPERVFLHDTDGDEKHVTMLMRSP